MTMFTEAHAPTTSPRTTLAGLARLFNVRRQRQALRKLDNAALKDIGLTRAQADAESGRSFWDAPTSWRN